MRRRWPLLALLTLAAAACAPAGATAPPSEPAAVGTGTSDVVDGDVTLPTVADAPRVDESVAPVVPRPGIPDLAAIHRDGTVTRVHDGVATSVARPADAADFVAYDGTTLIRATPNGGTTSVDWIHLLTGEVLAHADVSGTGFLPAATDPRAMSVALVNAPGTTPDGAIAPGREQSTIVLVDRSRGERSRVELDGNYQPEAIGDAFDPVTGPASVFVLEYVPPEAPTHYRVRVLWSDTGELGLPVNLRDKVSEVDASMAGISRTQVVAQLDGGLLFTLYRGVHGEDGRHGYAFVHTLGFANGVWCLDIPPEMELDVESGGLAVAGDRLVLASANGTVGSYDIGAVVDPAQSPAMDSVTQYLHPVGDPVLASTRERVWVAWGNRVYELDPDTLDMTGDAPYDARGTIAAMAATDDGVLVMAHENGEISTSSGGRMQLRADAATAGDGAGVVRLLTG